MQIDVVIPAAGIGKRMGSTIPKQYLKINNRTILEHTVGIFLKSELVHRIIICTRADDEIFNSLGLTKNLKIQRVDGGAERVDSVLNGLRYVTTDWVMVHDAARPCLTQSDIQNLVRAVQGYCGGILGCAVRDTMKRTDPSLAIQGTVDRSLLFHALTPQMFQTKELLSAIETAQKAGVTITDEASAMEFAGFHPQLVAGRSDNIKITQSSDLALAQFILEGFAKNGII